MAAERKLRRKEQGGRSVQTERGEEGRNERGGVKELGIHRVSFPRQNSNSLMQMRGQMRGDVATDDANEMM